MVSSIPSRLERWHRFFDLNTDQRRMLLVDYYRDPENTAEDHGVKMFWPENHRLHAEWALRHYADQMRRAEWLDDDLIPNLNLLSGTEIFAECFGSSVIRPESAMPFARHAVSSAEEAVRLKKPDLWSTPLRYQFEMADYVHSHEPDALIRMPDIQSPLDIAALVWDKADIYCAMIEEPEAVHELCEKCFELICDFTDEWFKRYGTLHIAHYPEYPTDNCITLSEDEIGVINSELFEEFSVPYLSRLSERYGGIGIHCCADSRHQWSSIKKIKNVKLLNISQPLDALSDSIVCFSDFCPQFPMDTKTTHEFYSRKEFKNAHLIEGLIAWDLDREKLIDTVAEYRSIQNR